MYARVLYGHKFPSMLVEIAHTSSEFTWLGQSGQQVSVRSVIRRELRLAHMRQMRHDHGLPLVDTGLAKHGFLPCDGTCSIVVIPAHVGIQAVPSALDPGVRRDDVLPAYSHAPGRAFGMHYTL